MRRTLLLVGLLVVLSACQLRADVDLRVDADGSGTFTVSLETDQALEEEAGAAGFDLPATIARDASELDGWEVTRDGRRVELTRVFDDPRDLRVATGAFAESLAGPELRPLAPLVLELTDERVAVRGGASLAPDVTGEFELGRREVVDLLDDGVVYTVSVVLPGELVSHNADRQIGDRLEWDVPAGERVDIFAASTRPDEPLRWRALLSAGAVVLVLVGVFAVGARRRRRRRRHFRDGSGYGIS